MNEINTRAFIYSREDVEKLIIDDLVENGTISKRDIGELMPIEFEISVFGKKKLKDTTVILEKAYNENGIEVNKVEQKRKHTDESSMEFLDLNDMNVDK